MKKLLILIVIILIGLFGYNHFQNNSNAGEQIIYQATGNDGSYSAKINLPDWQKADSKGTQAQYVVKFLPQKDDDILLGKEITVTFYNSTMNYYPESQYIAYVDYLRKMIAKQTQAPLDINVRSNSTNNVVFDWSTKGIPYSEMGRYVRTQKGLYFILFSQKKEGFTDEEKEAVFKMLKSFKEE